MSFTWSVFLNRGLRPLTTTCNQLQVLISHFTAANPVYPYRQLSCQLMSPVTVAGGFKCYECGLTGHLARDCREQRGSGRYDSRGPPPPRDDRGRDRRDDGGRREERETSEERRAKIASWNAEKEPSQD